MNADWRNRYEVAVTAARAAGKLALRYFSDQPEVEHKGDNSPVTIADREAEQLLRRDLLSRFPDDAFLGEESGDKAGSTGYRWIIDPIDGTRSFIRGIPLWGTVVGLEYQGETIAGVVALPALGPNEVFRALKGDGAYRGERRIRVSDQADLTKSVLFFSNLIYFKQAGRREDFLRLIDACERERGYSDVYGFMLVAQGAGEMMIEQGIHIWDVGGVKPIIEEAGGRFTDWGNTPTISTPDIIASNGIIHDAALAVLNRDRR